MFTELSKAKEKPTIYCLKASILHQFTQMAEIKKIIYLNIHNLSFDVKKAKEMSCFYPKQNSLFLLVNKE